MERSAAPSGLVTFVFTDIEGSTRLFRRLGEAYVGLLDRHHDLLREVWRRHGGYEVKTEGDSFLVAFADPDAALAACADAERALGSEPWPAGAEVRVRMGVHTGIASPHDGDYVAFAVHQAARVVSAAHGGQVLVSAETARRAMPPPAHSLRPLGRFRVRDFDDPVELCQLIGPGLESAFPAPRVLPADRHNLPRPTTELIGRDDELADLDHSVRPGRVTTLLGPGGVGKTRLAVEHALRTASRWPDGAWFVDLAPIGDPSLVTSTLATSLGRHTETSADLLEELLASLAERRMLVVFDNAEHVREEVARTAAALLQRAPDVGVLVTSREPLGLRGEVVRRVEPLAIAASPDAAAVELFLARSAEAGGTRAPTADRLASIATLCGLLDGLPLAIEMAAARTGVYTPEDILAGIAARGTQPLVLNDPTVADRHRTLDGLIQWSVNLLSAEEQVVFGRLGAFASSFGHETVAAVVEGVDASIIPDVLWNLANRSLVRVEPAGGATRYRLLDTVRSFVRAHDPDLVGGVLRLARWYDGRIGPGRPLDHVWVDAMTDGLDDLRWLATSLVAADQPLAQRLAWSIAMYHDVVQAYSSGIGEVARLVDVLTTPTPERVGLLSLLADLRLRVGQLDEAQAALTAAAELEHRVGPPPWDDAAVARSEGEVALRRGDVDAATAIAEAQLARTDLSVRGRGRMWNLLGLTRFIAGDPVAAAPAFEHELEIWESLGLEALATAAHGNVAEVRLSAGDVGLAAHHQLACLELALRHGQPLMIVFSLMVAARLAADAGDWPAAVLLQTVSDTELGAIGNVLYDEDRRTADQLLTGARAALDPKQYEDARARAATAGMAGATPVARDILQHASTTT